MSARRPPTTNQVLVSNRKVTSPRLASTVPPRPAEPVYTLGFCLFLLVNAVLFIRPAEIIADLEGLPIYEWVILACLLVSFPSVLAQLAPRNLAAQPITVCVLGMIPAIVLSHVAHFNLWSARHGAFEFFKVVVYYLLLVANVSSVSRLKHFLAWLVVMIGILTGLALLQYFELIEIPSLAAFQQLEANTTGEVVSFSRLQSTGIFNDPNDLCLILLAGMGICLFWITDNRIGWVRPLLVFPMGVFGFALYFTYSRTGFLAMLVGLAYLFRSRFSWGKTILLSALVLPAALWLFAGRQSDLDISNRDNTGQSRIQLWSAGLQLFRRAPLFGIGKDEYPEEVSFVAHNSFLHCFAELGLFGGTLFLGTFVCSFWMLHRLASSPWRFADPWLLRFRGYLLAIVVAYFFGLLSLSRSYVVTPYLILGLVTAFVRQFRVSALPSVLTFNLKVILRLGMASAAYLVVIYGIVRIFASWG
jgi:hypothetical protein